MINRFRKLFSGYASVRKRMNGKEYKFMYSEKPVFFDPNQMISDLIRNESNLNVRDLDSSETFQTILSKFPAMVKDASPSVICEFKAGDSNYLVSRYTFRYDNYPVSYYIFEEEKEMIGAFCRIYDYGSLLNSFAQLVEPDFVEEDETVNSWKWQTADNVMFYLEKFGHTQLWCWDGPLKKWK